MKTDKWNSYFHYRWIVPDVVYEVPINDIAGIIVSVANGIFDQGWWLVSEDNADKEESTQNELDQTEDSSQTPSSE